MEVLSEIEKTKLYTSNKRLIAEKHLRILKNNKVSYFEIDRDDIYLNNFYISKNDLFRFTDPFVYRIKFICNDESNVECFYQTKTVSFMDFKMGLFYIECKNVFDFFGNRIIKEEVEVNKNIHKFFN